MGEASRSYLVAIGSITSVTRKAFFSCFAEPSLRPLRLGSMTFFHFALSRPHLVLTGAPRLVPGKQWEVAVPMQCLFCLFLPLLAQLPACQVCQVFQACVRHRLPVSPSATVAAHPSSPHHLKIRHLQPTSPGDGRVGHPAATVFPQLHPTPSHSLNGKEGLRVA